MPGLSDVRFPGIFFLVRVCVCVCRRGLPYSRDGSRCDAGQLKCPGTGLCIEPEQLCDFSDDCLNGKDEEKCSECLEKRVDDDSFCTIFRHRYRSWLLYVRRARVGRTSKSGAKAGSRCLFTRARQRITRAEKVKRAFFPLRFQVKSFSCQGRYLHIETSAPHVQGAVAAMRSRVFLPPFDKNCDFLFHYSFHGSDIGALRLLLEEFDKSTSTFLPPRPIFVLLGEQGPDWVKARVPIRTGKPFAVNRIVTSVKRVFNFLAAEI